MDSNPEFVRLRHLCGSLTIANYLIRRAVVVAQLAERSLLTSEIRGSNPNIGNTVFSNVLIRQLQRRKNKNKEKEAGVGPFKKTSEVSPSLPGLVAALFSTCCRSSPLTTKPFSKKRRFFSQFQCFWLYLNFIGFRLGLSERGIRFEKEREGIKLEMEKEKM